MSLKHNSTHRKSEIINCTCTSVSIHLNDTTFITWQNVKQQHQVVRNILQSMEEKFSTYKMFIVDTAYFSNHLGYNLTFEFDNYVPIRNVIRHLDSMQKDTLAKFGEASYIDIRFLNEIPNDIIRSRRDYYSKSAELMPTLSSISDSRSDDFTHIDPSMPHPFSNETHIPFTLADRKSVV